MARQPTTNESIDNSSEALRLEQVRQGDAAAFERLFLRHYGQVYRVLYGLMGSYEEAEDLAQETFLALCYHPPARETGATLTAWLCRVPLVSSMLSTGRG